MKQFKAVYRGQCGKEFEVDLLANSLSSATMTAAELIPKEGTLLRVYYNPQWE